MDGRTTLNAISVLQAFQSWKVTLPDRRGTKKSLVECFWCARPKRLFLSTTTDSADENPPFQFGDSTRSRSPCFGLRWTRVLELSILTVFETRSSQSGEPGAFCRKRTNEEATRKAHCVHKAQSSQRWLEWWHGFDFSFFLFTRIHPSFCSDELFAFDRDAEITGLLYSNHYNPSNSSPSTNLYG